MCCPVQFSNGQPYSSTRFCCHSKFTLPEASLASPLARTFLPLHPFHTPASLPFVSSKSVRFCLFLIRHAALLYHLYTQDFDWKKTERQPPSVFLGQVQNEIQ